MCIFGSETKTGASYKYLVKSFAQICYILSESDQSQGEIIIRYLTHNHINTPTCLSFCLAFENERTHQNQHSENSRRRIAYILLYSELLQVLSYCIWKWKLNLRQNVSCIMLRRGGKNKNKSKRRINSLIFSPTDSLLIWGSIPSHTLPLQSRMVPRPCHTHSHLQMAAWISNLLIPYRPGLRKSYHFSCGERKTSSAYDTTCLHRAGKLWILDITRIVSFIKTKYCHSHTFGICSL